MSGETESYQEFDINTEENWINIMKPTDESLEKDYQKFTDRVIVQLNKLINKCKSEREAKIEGLKEAEKIVSRYYRCEALDKIKQRIKILTKGENNV